MREIAIEDSDFLDRHSFSIGDDRFEVFSRQLTLADGVGLDHGPESDVSVTAATTDNGGLSTIERLIVAVGDGNEAPIDIVFRTDVNGTLPTAPSCR